MGDRAWLIAATFGYLISSAWGAYALGASRPIATRWNNVLIFVSFLCHSMFLHQRGQATGHCPIGNLFETVAFFSWSLALTYLVIGSTFRMSILGAFTAPLVFLLNFFALVAPVDVPHPLLHMAWQTELHASLTVLGFGMLGIAALAGVMYLMQERQLKRRALTHWFYDLPAMGRLEIVHRRVLIWAFFLFSIGLLAGFFVPQTRAGDEIKIAWSAAVWILYACLLLAPRFIPLSHKKVAWASVAGYVFVLLTFWGVNSLSNSHRFNSGLSTAADYSTGPQK